MHGQFRVDEVERDQRVFFTFDGGGLSSRFSLAFAIISSIPSLISLTCGCTSLMRSCSILDNLSIRLPCSPSCFRRSFCLAEIRCIHQKQTAQQPVPTNVIQKAIRFLSTTSHITPASISKQTARVQLVKLWAAPSPQCQIFHAPTSRHDPGRCPVHVT